MRSRGCFGALGTTFVLRGGGRLGSALAEEFADLRAASGVAPEHTIEVARSGFRHWMVRCDGVGCVYGVDQMTVVDEVLAAVDELALSSVVSTDTVLHAGAVEIDGVAVALIGRRRVIGSMLVAAARAGCGYLANGVLAIDQAGMARSFPRPVVVREGGDAQLELETGRIRQPVRVGRQGSLSVGAPLGLIVFVEGVDVPVPVEVLSPAIALARLSNQVVGATGHERIMFRRLERLVRRVPVIVAADEGIDATVATVHDALGRRAG